MATSKDSLLILLAFLSVATSCVAEEKVSVDLYYESLCPYSAKFIVNYLGKFFTDGLIDIVDLRMIPYGNARIGPNETITCQVSCRSSDSAEYRYICDFMAPTDEFCKLLLLVASEKLEGNHNFPL
eukprot:Gb_39195 [translate_table: standard]